MPLPPCLHRDLADEAYRIDAATGAERRVDVWLCTWPTTIKAAPPWMAKRLGPSPAIAIPKPTAQTARSETQDRPDAEANVAAPSSRL